MLDVKFYETIEDSLLKFAVIICKSKGKWVFCKHKDRDTYEVPGGTGKKEKASLKLQKGSCGKKPGLLNLILPRCAFILLQVRPG